MPRWAEFVVAGLALVVLSPLLLLLWVTVLVCSGPPALYKQTRVGRNGQPFILLKFRTMSVGSVGTDRAPRLTVGVDPRVTRVGAFLRRRHLDELPQLVNVLRGEMSFVGARPEVPDYVLPDLADQVEVLRHRPGVTDPASLAFRNEAALLAAQPDPVAYYRSTLLPAKVRISADYLRRRSVGSDVRVLADTLLCLVAPSHGASGILPARRRPPPQEGPRPSV
ncbi:MAG: Sugar transferase [Frankiales bacterium]|nr:Sugar transferase [Frankiales bacterium]